MKTYPPPDWGEAWIRDAVIERSRSVYGQDQEAQETRPGDVGGGDDDGLARPLVAMVGLELGQLAVDGRLCQWPFSSIPRARAASTLVTRSMRGVTAAGTVEPPRGSSAR